MEYAQLIPVSEWIRAGDIITTSTGQLMKVKKVNPKNYVSVDANGGLWNVRRTPNVKKASNPEEFVDPEANAPKIQPGMLVRFNKASLRQRWGANVWVVTDDTGSGLKLIKLGGGEQRLRGFQPIDLDIVPTDHLAL